MGHLQTSYFLVTQMPFSLTEFTIEIEGMYLKYLHKTINVYAHKSRANFTVTNHKARIKNYIYLCHNLK